MHSRLKQDCLRIRGQGGKLALDYQDLLLLTQRLGHRHHLLALIGRERLAEHNTVDRVDRNLLGGGCQILRNADLKPGFLQD